MPGGAARSLAFLAWWLFAPILLVFLVSLRVAVFEPRYLIFAAPAFYLLAGGGAVALARYSWKVAGPPLAILLAFSLLGLAVQATTPLKSDFRAAAAYVRAHWQDESPIMFQMPYVRFTFDHYFDGTYPALDGPWTNDGKAEAQVNPIMTELLEGFPAVWLIESESWLWDSQGLARAWLDSHSQRVRSASFALVDVYYYDLLAPASPPDAGATPTPSERDGPLAPPD